MNERSTAPAFGITRRDIILSSGIAVAAMALPRQGAAATQPSANQSGNEIMSFVKTQDGTEIYYKDWGPKDAQPIVFHHGWPLSSDDWDGQMMYFLEKGYRVIAHDRRGHGRSTQTWTGNEMDTYAA
ncbi:Chloride peroxidase, partial [Rhizobium sp. PDO1-076]|uniref:alpha/beta fold hydrolase n=1 Tax=Rhizobium sp. PDO1-076 TaxID=1125979 RepID=UPI00024E25F2